MKWFERYAAKRKPDHKSPSGFAWVLLDFWKLRIALAVKTHSFLETRTCEVPSLTYVVSGKYLEHRKDGDKGADDYMYTDSEGRWVVHTVSQGHLRAFGRGDSQRLELYPAEKLGDKLLDMPEWMTVNEVEFNSEKQVWLLLFAWCPTVKIVSRIGE